MKGPWKVVLITIFGSLCLVALRFAVPQWIATNKNPVASTPPYHISKVDRAFHDTLRIADLHADSLLWGRNLLEKTSVGHIDLPRLLEANVSLQVFSVVTKTPRGLNTERNNDDSDNITLLALAQGWPWESITSLSARAIYQASILETLSQQSHGQLALIRSRRDLQQTLEQQKHDQPIVAALLSLEGAHALEGRIDNLDALYQAGYRMIGLTHFFDNQIGGSAHGIKQGGLTPFGRAVVTQAQAMHFIIDLSHSSDHLIDDVLAISTQPVIVSHTGVKGTCDHSRNLTNQQMQAIAATGGLIGIGFWPTAICGQQVADIVRAIAYVKDNIGVEYIALGSDFDGAVPTPFDVTGLPLLTAAIRKYGFTENEIRKIMGENLINLLLRTLPTE